MAWAGLWLLDGRAGARGSEEEAAGYRRMIETDWAAQEARLGRELSAPKAVQEAFARAERLRVRLRRIPGVASLQAEEDGLDGLRCRVDKVETLAAAERETLYREVRWIARSLVLKNPRVTAQPLVFLERRRFTTQMLHEYLGYFYDYADIAGGGVYLLEEPGRSTKTRDLIAGRLPRGNYTTLAMAYDAKTLYFGFAERAPQKPDFYSAERRDFHLFALSMESGQMRQLTEGPHDDFDPCPLPDGGIAFMSTRRGGFGRCHNPWEPLPAYTLHRMDATGQNVRTLSFHETNEWHPFVMNDGRIVYSRWDYVDRSAANFHGLWTSNPDGTNPRILFGNYTERINACYQPRAIPGSQRILFVAGGHHAAVGGSLVMVDPTKAALDPATGEDRLESIEVLTPEVCFPEAAGWPKSYFHSPWPLSEDDFFVSFSFDPLPGMGPGEKRDTSTGLYYMDRFGNLELLYRKPGISCMYPMPLAPRPTPPVIPSTLDPSLGDEGELVLADVNCSLRALPASRAVRELRVYQILPKTSTHVSNQPRIGYANAEPARLLLGTVPVEADGSARFRVPARKPIYFQAVDGSGRAVASMRSATYLQPGEQHTCVGCHEPVGTAPAGHQLLALQRAPSALTPGPEGSRPMSYPRLVQPVLDRKCVRCHDGRQGPDKSRLVLTGEPAGHFCRSYENLRPFVRWYEWGGASIAQITTPPGHLGADMSPLTRVLSDPVHAEHVGLTDEERRRLFLWLDANAPFYGTYGEAEQAAQQQGRMVAVPQVQ
jgi:hypothetical protein